MTYKTVIPYGMVSAISWYAALYGDGSIQWLYLGIISGILSCCMIVITATYHKGGHTHIRRLFRGYNTTYVILEEKIPIIKWLRRTSQNTLNRTAQKSGGTYDTERNAVTYTRRCVMMIPPCVILGICGHIFLDKIWLILFAVPIITYVIPMVQLRLRIRTRYNTVSGETAYFLSYVNIMQSIGIGLYRSFEIIHKSGDAFPAMRQDASAICRRVITGSTRNDSLLQYAKHHPVRIIRDFVSGYVTKQSAMGDVPGYTAQKAHQAFLQYETAWTRYEKSVQEIFGGIMMFAIVLPLMIMLSAMLGTPQTVRTLLVSGTAISPLISLFMIILLNQSQPSTGISAKVSPWSVMAGMLAGVMSVIADAPLGITISVCTMAFACANHFIYKNHTQKNRSSERILPEFLRDMTEMSRTGQSISQIICRQARQRIYGKHFDDTLERVAGKINSGYALEDTLRMVSFPGTNTRFVMFLLGVAHRTGSNTITILEMVTEFASKIQHIKNSVTKTLAPLCYIVYATPFITLGLAHLMLGIFAGSASGNVSGDAIPFSPISGDTLHEYIDGMVVMSAAMSIPMGVVAAKISSYTVRYTAPLGIVSFCNILAIISIPHIMEWLRLTG